MGGRRRARPGRVAPQAHALDVWDHMYIAELILFVTLRGATAAMATSLAGRPLPYMNDL